MSRYIDADNLLSRLPNDLPYKASVKRVLTQAPTADVVEVVRCKDCKRFLQMEISPSYDGKCLGYGYLVEAKHYCSYGERREE